MTGIHSKKLPLLPLSRVARDHRARLLSHLISCSDPALLNVDVHSGGGISNRTNEMALPGWLTMIDQALDDMGECMLREDWIGRVNHGLGSSSDGLRPNDATLKSILISVAPEKTSDSIIVLPPSHSSIMESLDKVSSLCCTFHSGVFVVPTSPLATTSMTTPAEGGTNSSMNSIDDKDADGPVLYGLSDWQQWCSSSSSPTTTSTTSSPDLGSFFIGGTFTITPPSSITPSQRKTLRNILKVGVYIQMTMMLEQDLWNDFGVGPGHDDREDEEMAKDGGNGKFTFPSVEGEGEDSERPFPLHSNHRRRPSVSLSTSANQLRQRWNSFIERKPLVQKLGTSIAHRLGGGGFSLSSPSAQSPIRSSLDSMTTAISGLHRNNRRESGPSSPPPDDGSVTPTQSRPGSSMGEGKGKRATGSMRRDEEEEQIFMKAVVEQMEGETSVLSTSPGVVIGIPGLMLKFGEKERKNVVLNAGERAGLASITGWDPAARGEWARSMGPGGTLLGRKFPGMMTGTDAFLRMQGMEVVVGRWVHDKGAADAGNGERKDDALRSRCGKEELVSLRYFADDEDGKLGDVVWGLMQNAGKECFGISDVDWIFRSDGVSGGEEKKGKDARRDSVATTATTTSSASNSTNTTDTTTSVTGDAASIVTATTTDGSVELAGEKKKVKKDKEKVKDSNKGRKSKCLFKQRDHEIRLIHGERCISIVVEGEVRHVGNGDDKEGEEEELKAIQVWSSCRVCGKNIGEGERELSEGASLFSFAKFLELLVYSPWFDGSEREENCEHIGKTTFREHRNKVETMKSHNILRHFTHRSGTSEDPSSTTSSCTVTFRVDDISDRVYDVKIPDVGHAVDGEYVSHYSDTDEDRKREGEPGALVNSHVPQGPGEDVQVLRKEIKKWWEGMSDYLDTLEGVLLENGDLPISDQNEGWRKALPRLPSSFDWVEAEENVIISDAQEEEKSASTPNPASSDNLHPLSSSSPNMIHLGLGKMKKHHFSPSIPSTAGPMGEYLATKFKSSHPPRVPEKDLHLHNRSPGSPLLPISSSASESTIQPPGTPTPIPSPRIEATEPLIHRSPSQPEGKEGEEQSAAATTQRKLGLLTSLRESFQRTEQSLYSQLGKSSSIGGPGNPGDLNSVRRAFVSAAKGSQRRLEGWRKKHISKNTTSWFSSASAAGGGGGNSSGGPPPLKCQDPEWFREGCHVLPGSRNVIVREDDWGSIIAYAMSSSDYQRELFSMGLRARDEGSDLISTASTPATQDSAGTTPLSNSTSTSGFFSNRFFPSSSAATTPNIPTPTNTARTNASTATTDLDPDKDDGVWYEQEPCTAVISRKDHHHRESSGLSFSSLSAAAASHSSLSSASLLSIQGVLRSGTGGGGFGSLGLSKFGSRSSSHLPLSAATTAVATTTATQHVPPSALGEGGGPAGAGALDAGQKLTDIQNHLKLTDRRPHPYGGSVSAMSLSSLLASGSTATEGRERSSMFSARSESDKSTSAESQVGEVGSGGVGPPTSSANTFGNTLTTGFSNAMVRMGWGGRGSDSGAEEQRRSSTPTSISDRETGRETPPHPSEGLVLPLTPESVDDSRRPHIQYDWIIGKRLKFGCTIYYARQFELLRRRCGIFDYGGGVSGDSHGPDDLGFLRSLSECRGWEAEGGKSKSNFWKTKDERFIVKTLVNAWNVADLQVLIEFAPSYFKYLESTAAAKKPSSLAKVLGFYTVEIKNLETGTVLRKADLLIMENLFYKQQVNRTFDLKGIQARKKKKFAGKTLFDGEWIEGQQHSPSYIRPHAKVALREAVKNDAAFLAKCNIMDYSLLLGIDTERKLLSCGLVDTIGSYTFAKTLEYKAKQGLSGGGKEVTVIPPAEYQSRFVNALEGYFVACPDKWTKPLNMEKNKASSGDAGVLPCVL